MLEPSKMNKSSSKIKKSLDKWLQIAVDKVLNDDLMIALAAVLAIFVIFQLLAGEFSVGMQAIFKYLNYIIIGVFVAEYIVKLYLSEERGSFIVDPLRVLDLIIILLALLDISEIGYLILPAQAQLSPILRLFRPIIRALLALLLAGRTAERIKDRRILPPPPPQELQMATLDLRGGINRTCPKDAISSIMLDKTPLWIDFQNIKEIDLDIIEKVSNIPHETLKNKLLSASFPRIDPIKNFLTIFFWDSKIASDCLNGESFNVTANNTLVVFNEEKIVTLCKGKSHLFDRIANNVSHEIANRPFIEKEFTDKILFSLLQQKIIDYSEIVQGIEYRTIEFEGIPVDKTSSKFLEETFHFKKEILKISSNIGHFQKILLQLTDKKNIELYKIDNKSDFDRLHDESKYLYETTQNIKESLTSLIELHTNTVSYDMNRVMKVIAVITCIAIIPATIGGLLGVNLQEGNFHIKLTEILFLVSVLMLLGVYIFHKMDWLK